MKERNPVGLFKPYDADEKATASQTKDPTPAEQGATATVVTVNKNPQKKSVPTPTRRQAEDARRQRLQPVLTKKEARAKEREARYKARDDAMARTHARPYNALIRDWVDRRLNLAEFMLPVMLLILVSTVVGSYWAPSVMVISMYAMYGLVLLLVIDTVWMWVGCRRQLKEHFPDESLKGKMGYAISRAMLVRRSRLPLPRVKRFSKFEWPYAGDAQ